MKKLISLLLAMAMVVSLAVTGFATAEISEGGWRGEAVITDVNPGTGDRGDIVKVNGTATLTPNVNAIANTPIIEMTADIYGTGIVALVNGEGTAAATVTVTAETAGYKANDWNEVKLLAVTGLKNYKAFVNGTEVASGTVSATTTPVKISFAGSDLYVDDIVLNEYRKNGAYAASQLENSYTPTNMYNTNRELPEMDGADGKWSVLVWNHANSGRDEAWHTGSTIKHLPVELEDETKKHVVKMTKLESARTNNNTLTYNGGSSGNAVYSFDICVEEEDVTDEEAGTKAPELVFKFVDENSKEFSVASLHKGSLVLANGYNKANAYTVGTDKDWHNVRIELNKETQSADVFWDNVKANAYPVSVGHTAADGFNSITKMQFYINYTLGKATYYMANFKVDELSLPGGVVTETVFEENFDGTTNKFSYNANGNADSYLELTSGVSKDSRTVGRMEFMAHSHKSFVGVSETLAATTAPTDNDWMSAEDYPQITSRAATAEEYYSVKNFNSFSSNEKLVGFKMTYDSFNASVARNTNNTKADTLYVEYVDNDAQTPVILSHYIHQTAIYGTSTLPTTNSSGSSKTIKSGSNANRYQSWASVLDNRTDLEHRNLVYSDINEGNVGLNIGNAAYGFINAQNNALFRELDEIRIYLDSEYGGVYYLDNFKVEAILDYGTPDVIDECYEAVKYYENAIEGAEVPEGLAVADVAISNGAVDSVTLSKNGFTIPEGAKMFVAVYNGTALLDCGVAGVADSDFVDGSKTYTFTGVDHARDSVVKVFILNGTTLVPLYTMDAPRTVFIVGDSLVQDYVGLTYENGQSGWGEIEKIGAYLNAGQVVIKDYAIGGTSSKDFFTRLQETEDGDRFNIPDDDFWAQVKAGDYIFICTGTNDSKFEQPARYADPYAGADVEGSYLNNLVEMYIKPAEAKGAIPVLVTPGAILGSKNSANGRYLCTDGGNIRPIDAYAQTLRAFAETEKYAIVDLWALWTDMLSSMSTEDAKTTYYVSSDNTHTNGAGAAKAAEFIAICLEQIDGIKEFVK